MDPRTKASILWGVIGSLSFLVLIQGYELFANPGIGFGAKLLVALAVGIVAAVTTHLTRDSVRGVGEPDR